jgi:hypothetical protein
LEAAYSSLFIAAITTASFVAVATATVTTIEDASVCHLV